MGSMIHASLAIGAAAAAPVGFACSAQGIEAIAPLSAAEACARLRTALETALGVPLVDSSETEGGAVRVALSFSPVIAKAEVIDARDRAERTLPVQSVSSTGRPLRPSVIDTLARAIATALTKS